MITTLAAVFRKVLSDILSSRVPAGDDLLDAATQQWTSRKVIFPISIITNDKHLPSTARNAFFKPTSYCRFASEGAKTYLNAIHRKNLDIKCSNAASAQIHSRPGPKSTFSHEKIRCCDAATPNQI